MVQTIVMDEVEAINRVIENRIGQHKYRVWFKNNSRISLADGELKIEVPNMFISSWLENHFQNDIEAACKEVIGTELHLCFSINPAISNRQKKHQIVNQTEILNQEPITITKQPKPSNPINNRLKLDLDSFVVGNNNQLAYSAARSVVSTQKSPYNPLFFHGGYGIGKTHLLQGICNELHKARGDSKWIYISAEDFTNQFILAMKTKKLETFRRKFREIDLLAIDDIHFFASKPSTQEEFLHTFNAIDLAGKQLVLACDAHPKMIDKLCDKLVNRFVSGMVIKIEQPDFQTRYEICKSKLSLMKKSFPEPVIKYVAEHIKANVRELEGALLKLTAFEALNEEKLSVGLAEKILSEHITKTDPLIRISDIESAAANYFGLTTADIHSSKKEKTISIARSISMFLARKYTNMSYPEIGKLMGNKNHATVILACRKVQDYITLNSEISWRSASGTRIAKIRGIIEILERNIR